MKKILLFIRYPLSAFLMIVCLNVAYGDPNKTITQKIIIDGQTITYDSTGKGENILLIHGLFASKDQWQNLTPYLSEKGYHVIAPDLPGYGKNLNLADNRAFPKVQIKLLHQLVQKLHLGKVNIAGSSMGGYVAALYAKQYPSEVSTLAFMGGPFGIQPPNPSKVDKLLEKGVNPFIPATEKQLHDELVLLFNKSPKLSPENIQKILSRYTTDKTKYTKVWAQTTTKNRSLFNKPFSINFPTLIIWGDQDNVFDVSAATILKNNIANSALVIVGNGSHLLFIEDPQGVARHYLNFLAQHKG